MANFIDIVNEYPKVNITVTAGELLEFGDYLVNRTRKELERQITDANTETYPSADRVAKLLGVDKAGF